MILKFDRYIDQTVFEEESLAKEQPCVITGIIDEWEVYKVMSRYDAGVPIETVFSDLASFLKLGMDTKVPVIFTGKSTNSSEYGNGECKVISLTEYQKLWEDKDQVDDHYLKDWHFVQDLKDSPSFYSTPKLFEKDLLNQFCEESSQSDYKFLYFGPTGSSTAFHHDVVFSHSWSANVIGKKKWTFYDTSILSETEIFSLGAREDILKSLETLEVYQGPGETVVVPSGWYHKVENLEATLSVNHNWITNHCIRRIENYMLWQSRQTEDSLDDLRDVLTVPEFAQKCEQILRLNVGINMKELYRIKELGIQEYR